MPITVLSALGTYCNMHSKPMGDASVPENSTVPVGTKDTLRGDPSTETTGAWVSMENSWVATSVSSLPLTANWYWPSGKPLQSHAWVTAALRVCVPFPVQRQLIYKTSISSHFGQATPVFVRRFTWSPGMPSIVWCRTRQYLQLAFELRVGPLRSAEGEHWVAIIWKWLWADVDPCGHDSADCS